jgi:signal transduction histidine kinase/HAMP domain-containing protein
MTLRLRHLPMGLKTKFVLTISFLILLTSVILSVFLIEKQSQLIQRELEKRGESMARNLAHNSEYGVLVESDQLLSNLMEGLFLEEEVMQVAIRNRKGAVLADWGRTEEYRRIHRERFELPQPGTSSRAVSKQYFVAHGMEFYSFSCPIKTTRVERSKEEVGILEDNRDVTATEEVIGTASVGLSLQNMRREIADMTQIVVLLTVLVVAVGIALTMFLVNIFIKPVKRLVYATERVASGNFSQMVNVTTKDEIGTLASSFNRMIASLQESRQKIEEYNRTLERKVRERTAELEKTTRLLQVEYDRLEAIINSPNLGIVIEDMDCNIRFMNKFLIETFGNQIGEKCYRKFKDRDRKCPVCPIDEILVKGKKTFTYLDQDAFGHHYELSASLFQDEKGEQYILETMRDVTAQKKLETQVQEYTRNLEKTNRELESALKSLKETQVQLIQVEKMAAVGQLAAGVAHELNNPLGGILGYSQFALEKINQKPSGQFGPQDTADFLQYLQDIEQQTKRCRSIIQNLLKFSRSSRKEEFESTDLNQVVNETLTFTRHQVERSKVHLSLNLQENLPPISGHPSQLQQVFTNLILNAVQAMPQGGSLTISTVLRQDEDKIHVSFADTGQGIARENLDKIFEPFFSTKKVGEGTGLGLSVSYGLIRNHGGEIKVTSEAGRGTVFTVVLPVGRDQIAAPSGGEAHLASGGHPA